jgi:hypothetical protein
MAPAAWAQDDAESDAEEATPGVSISGFVDTSISVPDIDFPVGGDGYVIGFDQLELDFETSPEAGLTIRADLNWTPENAVAAFDDLVEQGYVEAQYASGLYFAAGKMNAPVGAEATDPVDMYQYSHGLLFDRATPGNLTGFFTGYTGDAMLVRVWGTSNWDRSSVADNLLVGGRFEYSMDGGHTAVSATMGPITDREDSVLMVDVDTAWNFDKMTVFGEFNFGQVDSSIEGEDALTSIGFMVKVNYALSDMASATIRFDSLDRFDAFKGMSATAALLFSMFDNVGALVEVRADMPDAGDDPDNEPPTVISVAAEVTAWF